MSSFTSTTKRDRSDSLEGTAVANNQLKLNGAVDADPSGCLLSGLIAIAIGLTVLAFAVDRVADAIEAASQPSKEAPIAH